MEKWKTDNEKSDGTLQKPVSQIWFKIEKKKRWKILEKCEWKLRKSETWNEQKFIL